MKKERRVEDRFKQSRQPFEYNCSFPGQIDVKVGRKVNDIPIYE